MKPGFVSIVIPSYNHLDEFLKPCIDSLIKYTDLTNTEIIISANGCTDGTGEFVIGLPDFFKVVWNRKLLGFPKAVNEGIKVSSGEFIVILNNDIVVLDGSWLPLLKAPFSDPVVGITGPLKGLHSYINRAFLIFFCAMIRREVFDRVGLLDECFGNNGGDDTDFCVKAENLGYKLVQVPYDKKCYDQHMNQIDGLEYGEDSAAGWFPIYHKSHMLSGFLTRTGSLRNVEILVERYGKG